MVDSGNLKFSDSSVSELTGKIMVVGIIILFFVVVFVFCLHLYIKWLWNRRQENTSSDGNRRRRSLDFATARQEMAAAAALRKGLDPSVLNPIPITVYDAKEFKDGLECSVCLCEVNDGEKARILPKCNHGFHMECIDIWFQSHSTFPICRNPAANQTKISLDSVADSTIETMLQIPAGENSSGSGLPTETPNLPTNVLFCGDETQVSTVGPCTEEDHQNCSTDESSSSSIASSRAAPDGMLVIDIPRPINEKEEQKSPIPKRFRSLKRLLSGKRPSSPKHMDLEQGAH